MSNSQIETVTLPREVVQKAELLLNRYLKETPLGNQPHMIALEAAIAVKNLRAALDAPQAVDCRGCKHHRAGLVGTGCYVSLDTGKPVRCTNFDKFQALPPISLTKVTK